MHTQSNLEIALGPLRAQPAAKGRHVQWEALIQEIPWCKLDAWYLLVQSLRVAFLLMYVKQNCKANPRFILLQNLCVWRK